MDNLVQKPMVLIRKNGKDIISYYDNDKFYDKNDVEITDFEGAYLPVDGKLELVSKGNELDNFMYGYKIIS